MDQSGDGANGFNRRRRSSDEDYLMNRPMNRRRTNGANGDGNGNGNGAAGEAPNAGDDDPILSLSLSLGPQSMTSSQPPTMDSSPKTVTSSPPVAGIIPPLQDPAKNSAGETLRTSTVSPANGKPATVPPPYPWATNQRGRIHSLEFLESKQITAITGDVQCKHCEKVYQMSYDLREKFSEVERFIEENKDIMRERAPATWMYPMAMKCEFCEREKAVKPVISDRKRKMNWLFLLLGKNLGYCTLEQLKYFCKHSNNHRTGAKDRVLYLTYLGLCKMLKPCKLFNR